LKKSLKEVFDILRNSCKERSTL